MASQEAGSKTLTGFQLETKIRVIIRELLQATSNKLVEFGSRIDGFQKHFFSFNDRVVKLEEVSGSFESESSIVKDRMASLTDTFHAVSDKTQEESQKARFMMADQVNQFKDIEAKLKLAQQTNDKILAEHNKTKNKFIEVSNNISQVRIELEKKINKFVESNISINVEIKAMFSTLSNDMFRMSTTVENQHKRFEAGMMKLDEQVVYGREMKERFSEMENDLLGKVNVKELEKHLLEAQSQLQASNRRLEERLLEEISGMIEKSPLLVDLIKEIKQTKSELEVQEQDIERMEKNLLGRFIDFQTKINTFSDQAEKNTAKEFQKIEKAFEAKLDIVKSESSVIRKEFSLGIRQLKKEMETLLSERTEELLKQEKVAQEQKQLVSQEIIVQQLKNQNQEQQNSMNKRLEMLESRFTNMMTEQMDKIISQVKTEKSGGDMTMDKELMDNMLKEISESLNEKMRVKVEGLMERMVAGENRLSSFQENVQEDIRRISGEMGEIGNGFEGLKRDVERESQMSKSLFDSLKSETEERLQKMSFIITKLRGDLTLKTEFISKEIKELTKKIGTEASKLEGCLRIIPAMGQAINLILALYFDNEATKDNLSDKFTTMIEGILYQFKGKSKSIHYRHKPIIKMNLLKAIFMGYTDVWEALLQANFKGMPQYFPKSFYTQFVEKRLQSLLLEKDGQRRNTKSPEQMKKTSIHILKQQAEEEENEPVSQETLNNIEDTKKSSKFNIRRQKSFDKSKTLTEENLGIFESPTRRNSRQFTQLQFK